MISSIQVKISNIINRIKNKPNQAKEEKAEYESKNNSELLTPQGQYNKNEILLRRISRHNHGKILFESFAEKEGKVSFRDYYTLEKYVPNARKLADTYIESNRPSDCTSAISPKLSAHLAIGCKNYLDKQYGKHGYKIVSIGTSPSFITEPMSAMGSDVVFFPISSLNRCCTNDKVKNILRYFPNLKIASLYLKSKLENMKDENDKKIILLDYYNTGKTLDMVEKILNEFCNIKKPDYKIICLQDLINQASLTKTDYFTVTNAIADQEVGILSNTPHFNVEDDSRNKGRPNYISADNRYIEEIFKDFEDFSTPYARIYNYCVLDEIAKISPKK